MKMVLVGVSKREKKKQNKKQTTQKNAQLTDNWWKEGKTERRERENVLTYDLSKSRQINKDHYFFSLLRFVVKLIQLFQLRKHEIREYVKMEFNDEILKTNSLGGKEFAVFFKYQTMLEMECNRKPKTVFRCDAMNKKSIYFHRNYLGSKTLPLQSPSHTSYSLFYFLMEKKLFFCIQMQ